MSLKIFCLDTETSAGSRDGRIVQVAIVDENFRGEWLINPDSYIQPGCINVHKITPEMVADKPFFKQSEWYKELMRRVEDWQFLIAHHAPFDIWILSNEWVHLSNYICTCKVARKILKVHWVPRFWLQFLKDYLKLEEINSGDTLTWYAHSALYDTIVLYWLYKYLYVEIQTQFPWEDPHDIMYNITHDVSPTKRFTFWKYKWKSIKEISKIDIWYLKWLYNSEMENPEPKRRKSLIIWLEIYISQ